VAYGSPTERPEPWEPNATADPQAAKWKELLSAGIGLPTPWPKLEFERWSRIPRPAAAPFAPRIARRRKWKPCSARSGSARPPWLAGGPNAGKVGAFEGAMYQAKATTCPQQDCIMFTRDEVGFCAVCRRAIERIIALYAR